MYGKYLLSIDENLIDIVYFWCLDCFNKELTTSEGLKSELKFPNLRFFFASSLLPENCCIMFPNEINFNIKSTCKE